MIVLYLLAAYGLAFGLQNKALFLRKAPFFQALLRCIYCTGFHTGWAMGILYHLDTHMKVGLATIPMLVAFAFASAAFSYALDTLIRWVEGSTPSARK